MEREAGTRAKPKQPFLNQGFQVEFFFLFETWCKLAQPSGDHTFLDTPRSFVPPAVADLGAKGHA